MDVHLERCKSLGHRQARSNEAAVDGELERAEPEQANRRTGGNLIKARDRAVEGRNDLSRFVAHLTRDDRADFPDGGQTARENFKGIVEDREILAFRPHCLHMGRIPERHRERFSVCCFTEVPLSELHLLTRAIPGRRIKFSDYGFVFSREFLVSKGAQPALYVKEGLNK